MKCGRRGISIEEDNETQTSGLEFDPYEEKRGGKYGRGQSRLGLRELFVCYARLGEHGSSSGQRISLNQSDKWLKQSEVIDNWNVTTTDTAIAFRKLSRFDFFFPFSSAVIM